MSLPKMPAFMNFFSAIRAQRRRQGGSVIVFAAIGLSAVVILLSLADIGTMYFYRREFQKAADLAALAGAKSLQTSCAAAQTAASSNASQNLGSRSYVTTVDCGVWNSSAGTMFSTPGTGTQNAVRVTISGTPPRFLMGGRAMSAYAIAISNVPLANLTIRSALVSIDSSKGALLNSLLGNMLGGALNLSLASWQGLVNANVNLLSYMDALALRLGVSAGNYAQVLSTNTTLGTLLGAMVDAMGSGSTAGIAVNSLIGSIGGTVGSINNLTLGSLLSLQSGLQQTGLAMDLNALQLAQAMVQLANYNSSINVSVPINLIGLAAATVTARIIQPPQISATGNPALAKANPTGSNKIYVRDAQVRVLISVSLSSALTSLVSGLTTAVSNLVSPVTDLLNNLLHLNLVAVLSCLVLCTQTGVDIQILSPPFRIDVNVDAGAGSAYVTDYSCDNAGTNKSLTVAANTSALALRIGKMGTSDADAISKVFASSAAPTVSPVPLVDIGTVTKTCTLLAICFSGARVPFAGGGIGLQTDTSVAASSATLNYVAPAASNLPTLKEDPYYQTISSSNIVSSLSATLAGAGIQIYQPTSPVSGLGLVISLVGTTLDTIKPLLQTAVATVLSPLLDPLVNTLLNTLGVTLAQTDVGARMTCNSGATLVN